MCFVILLDGCGGGSPAAPTGSPPVDVFSGMLTADAPVFGTTVGPAGAGQWRADLAKADSHLQDPTSHPVSLTVRDPSGNLIATGTSVSPFFLTTQWTGAQGATYHVEIVLEDASGLVLGEVYTLEVTHPLP